MLAFMSFSTSGFVVTPSHSQPLAVRRANVFITAEDEAKAKWLAKLDAHSWGRAAQAILEIATEAADYQAQTDAREDALSKEQMAKEAWLAKLDVPSWGNAAKAMEEIATVNKKTIPEQVMSEEEAKKAWLAKLDAPVWGKAAETMISVVAEANKIADLTEDCTAGDSAACDMLSKEDEAKKAWLAKLDVPSWGKTSEEQAKKKWLAKLETPSWQGKVTPTSQNKVKEHTLFD